MTSKLFNIAAAALMSFGAAVVLDAGSAQVSAQDISASHTGAARKALTASRATTSFDGILINAATALKNQLSSTNPDKSDEISNVVDEEAIALAARRADLENEAARIFASTFSEAELNQIESFFQSEAGKKYLDSAPILARELQKSARVWANGIQRDLTQNVTKKLSEASN
ncbi:MAG: DUF2059 domain-containing protein [Pseudomonadota bacterium]